MRAEKGLFLMAMWIWLAGPVRAESLEVLLERAMYEEETAGNYAEAIRLYQRVIEESEVERHIHAKALLRIAECKFKLGEYEEAVDTYHQLKEMFPQQTKLLDLAQARLDGLAPVVVRTVPEILDEDVSPDLDRLTVTYDMDMTKSWAWVRRFEDRYPVTTGKPSYDEDMRTCTLPVALEPGKVYWIELNSGRFVGFLSKLGIPARRHLFVFATRSADGPTPIPEEEREMVRKVNAGEASKPLVVRTSPPNYSQDVDPRLGVVSVTFDQEMKDKHWSWVSEYASMYPKSEHDPTYDRQLRTCSLHVHLEPGKVYWIQFNSPKYKNFQSRYGTPARPHVLLFATHGEDGSRTVIPAHILKKVKEINGP
ncbi:MAG: tetratricopeptide repeat protein [Deltaproteobacteria bacterium]|nr:tetratricopeptide repeat protein [Deltaproteobacteria bacterium]